MMQDVTSLQVEDSRYCPHNSFHCLFISGALSYGALAVRNFRPDCGGCRPLGRHCTLRGNHLYSTPEVTEEHEIGKQLKHHSAREALGTEKSSCFRGEGLRNVSEQLLLTHPPGNSFSNNLPTNRLCSIKLSATLDRASAAFMLAFTGNANCQKVLS